MVWLILLLVLLLLLAVLFVRYKSANNDTFQKMNIDSPPTSWCFGNLGDIYKHGIFKTQQEWYMKYSDKKVYGIYYLQNPVLVVRELDMIKDITVKYFNNFVNRRAIFEFDGPFKDNLLTIKDDHWRHVRSAVSPTFSSSRVKRMSQHVERNSQRLVDILRAKQERSENIELNNIISHFTLDVIASTGFGLEINTMENPENPFAIHARKCIKPSTMMVWLAILVPWLLKLLVKTQVSGFSKESLTFFTKAIDSAMENRKEEGQAGKVNDFMDLLINAEHESGQSERVSLTRSEIHGQTILFILAGYDTISTVLSLTMFLLANNPECCQMVQKEIDENLKNESPTYDNVQGLNYLDMCINESMRMFPQGYTIERICANDVTTHGIHIPKDMVVAFPVYAIHHDPEIWPEPEKFQPERFSPENKESRHPYAHLPFGHGPRNCIGMRMSLLQLKVSLAYVLKVLTPVPCEKTVYPVRLHKFKMKAIDKLWVKLEVRK